MCHGKTEVFPDQDGSDPYSVRGKKTLKYVSQLSHLLSGVSLELNDGLDVFHHLPGAEAEGDLQDHR